MHIASIMDYFEWWVCTGCPSLVPKVLSLMHSCAAITELVQQDDVTVSEPLQHPKMSCSCLRAAV